VVLAWAGTFVQQRIRERTMQEHTLLIEEDFILSADDRYYDFEDIDMENLAETFRSI
jgi:hypothetical protein